MKRFLILLMLIFGAGCSQYTAAQIDLVQQARRGVELCRRSQSSHRQWVELAANLQKEKLATAFDADLRDRADASEVWMIEHRQAYTAALAAIQSQRDAAIESDVVQRSNLDAVDQALRQLLELQNIQSNIAKKVEVKP